MEIEIKELLEGKNTIIKNKEYLSTKQYCEPFLNKMSKHTDDFRVSVKLPNQMTLSGQNNDITFNRVLIQAVLPEKHNINGHQQVIGFLYGLDVRKPVSKMYKGYLNSACMNLTVFNPSWQISQDIIPEETLNYNVNKLIELDNDGFAQKLDQLKNTTFPREQAQNKLGQWVHESLSRSIDLGGGNSKIGTSIPIKAYKNVFIDAKSDYFIPMGVDPDLFTVYNAFTQCITDDKDLMNKFEKTMIVNKLFNI